MPVTNLTNKERHTYSKIPVEADEPILLRYFVLTGVRHMKVVAGGKKFLPGRRLDVPAQARILPKPDLSGGRGTKMGGGPAERGRSWRQLKISVN
jgi:hypothetical protein